MIASNSTCNDTYPRGVYVTQGSGYTVTVTISSTSDSLTTPTAYYKRWSPHYFSALQDPRTQEQRELEELLQHLEYLRDSRRLAKAPVERTGVPPQRGVRAPLLAITRRSLSPRRSARARAWRRHACHKKNWQRR